MIPSSSPEKNSLVDSYPMLSYAAVPRPLISESRDTSPVLPCITSTNTRGKHTSL